ncbi:MAG: PQQ-dependent sugar dehydrogenase, partial [Thermoproteota archaeon]|nr:PQQ-dependent sugar dehydrogenase [Thermoproteota archaeon]
VIMLFLYCFSLAIHYFDNYALNGIVPHQVALPAFGQQQSEEEEEEEQVSLPQLNDESLRVEPVVESGLISPTSMVFLDNDTLLVTQKDNGEVVAIINGTVKSQPVMSVEVETRATRGILGVTAVEQPATLSSSKDGKLVFLYYTELFGQNQVRNRVYRYEWDQANQILANGTMVLDLPSDPGPGHNGGKIQSDLNGNLYVVIGDLFREGQLQNIRDGPTAQDSSVILRITEEGNAIPDNPFFNSSNGWMQKYYGYGIRNSFGLAIDPISGFVWDTENGDESYDEINIVHPGFNSGWSKIMGPISRSDIDEADLDQELAIFEGSKYADPVFSWQEPIGVTDLEFLNSTGLGPKYAYNLFVGDINNGNLYYFKLNENRTSIKFDANDIDQELADHIADNDRELSQIVFGSGFGGGITDIETGPDGFLYILTFNGSIYRILPSNF